MKTDNLYIVIMAGGSGTRLWPLSRKRMPKQFHPLLSSTTLLQETFRRAQKVVPLSNIFISTSAPYKKLILDQVPEMCDKHLIIEPVAKNTAPAIGLIAKSLVTHDPNAIVATIASDHAIGNVKEFVNGVSSALSIVKKNPEKICTLGIIPTNPDTGLGYIQIGKKHSSTRTHEVRFVAKFKEKPDEKTAKKYLESEKYLWNAGYFIFHANQMSELFNSYLPDTAKKIDASLQRTETGKTPSKTEQKRIFGEIANEPIDTALIEKLPSNKRLVVPTKLEWSDIGTWKSLVNFKYNTSKGTNGNHIDHLGKNCYIKTSPNKIVATIGLKDVVIIDTPDALLVADIHKAHEVKKIIEELEKKRKKKCL